MQYYNEHLAIQLLHWKFKKCISKELKKVSQIKKTNGIGLSKNGVKLLMILKAIQKTYRIESIGQLKRSFSQNLWNQKILVGMIL